MTSPGARALAAIALALALHPSTGAAELLRCKGPDGKTIFTDNKALCPGAEPYEPSAELQGAATSQPAAREDSSKETRMRTLRRMRVEDAEAGEAARWQAMKRDKEDELKQVAAERDRLVNFVSWCNRGGAVVKRDDAGLAKGVKCNELNDRLAALDERAASIRSYLDKDLPEECRRAGCLPGWIR